MTTITDYGFHPISDHFRDAVVDQVKQASGYGKHSPVADEWSFEWHEGFISAADCAQIVFSRWLKEGRITLAAAPTPATEPVRGSADGCVEHNPSPRSVTNRLTSLEETARRTQEVIGPRVEDWPSVSDQITDMQRQVTELTERVQDFCDVYRRANNSVVNRVDELTEAHRVLNEEQVPQIIKNFDNHDRHFDVIYRKLGLDASDKERVSAAEADAAINPTPDQPAADDAEDEAICEVCKRPVMWGSRHVPCGEYAMGLVSPRIDPDDMEQLRVVMETSLPPQDDDIVTARRILTALAGLNGGGK